MNFKLKNRNGKVTFLLKTGKDYSKNEMSISAAQHIIDSGKLVESEREGYPICVDEKWYFEGEPVRVETPDKQEGQV
jgi:uncharacterized protein YeeX (DUF496 family)